MIYYDVVQNKHHPTGKKLKPQILIERSPN